MAGVIGADLSARIVLILGCANLLADGFSMAAANYSGTRAEIDEYQHIRHMEERHVDLAPEGEREEVRQIFKSKGFKGKALESAVDVITEQRELWIDTMMTEEHGLPPVARSPLRAGSVTFMAFVLCGAVPILPFALLLAEPILPATVMTGLTFFAIGSLRSRWSSTPWCCGDSNWPKSLLYIAGWGYGHATLNGEPLYQGYEIHFMVTQGMRDRQTLKVRYPLLDKRSAAGAVDPAAQQLDFFIRSPEADERNNPTRKVFDHFFAREVTWK